MEDCIIKLMESNAAQVPQSDLQRVMAESYRFTTGLEDRKYLVSLYHLRLDMAKREGRAHSELAHLVENLRLLNARQVRLSTFEFADGTDISLLSDPAGTLLVGYMP